MSIFRESGVWDVVRLLLVPQRDAGEGHRGALVPVKVLVAAALAAGVAVVPGCRQPAAPAPGGQVPDGGDCAYRSESFPARVTAVTEWGAGLFQVDFVVHGPDGVREVSFNEVNGRLATGEEVGRAGVIPGAVFTYEEKAILSGHCTPEITRLRLDPWKGEAPSGGDGDPSKR